jgi:hypothetical protein
MKFSMAAERRSDLAPPAAARADVPEVLQALVDTITAEVAGVDLVGYFEPDGADAFVARHANKAPTSFLPEGPVAVPVADLGIDLARDVVALQLLAQRRPIYVEDARRDPRPDPAQVRMFRIRSIYGLPLQAGGRTIGVVFLYDQGSPMDLPPEKRRLVEALVADAATALEQAGTDLGRMTAWMH